MRSALQSQSPNRGLKSSFPCWGLGLAVLSQSILLFVAGLNNWPRFNTDAIAYMRLAEHYAMDHTQLMISAYWGPLMSWLMVPWIWLGLEPLTAAHIVMGLSGAVFLFGTVVLLTKLELSQDLRWGGTMIAALTGVVWSVQEITPDLLLAGLLALLAGSMISEAWLESRKNAWFAGFCMGLAYLCKAVGLPLSLGCWAGFGLLWGLSKPDRRRVVLQQMLRSLLVLGLLAGPWIGIISWKSQRLLFSSSARIGHAIVGPEDKDRAQPFGLRFHQPPRGRLTTWEDPSNLPYEYWSPWESKDYAFHQLNLLRQNARVAAYRLSELDLIGLSLLVTMGGIVWLGIQGVRSYRCPPLPVPGWRWCWTLVPVICLIGIYLPVYAVEARFYYPCFPMVLAASLGAIHQAGIRWPDQRRLRNLVVCLLLMCYAGPAIIQFQPAVTGFNDPAITASWDLALRIKRTGVTGALAGSGMIQGQRAGLYTAFILNRPWHGDERHPTPESFLNSGASLMILKRQDPAVAAFQVHPSLRDMDAELFESPDIRENYPLKVFQSAPRGF